MEIKYAGYIQKDRELIARLNRMEERIIPDDVDYRDIAGLKNEAREKLVRVQPRTIGQAMRISGVDPSDASILLVHLEARERVAKKEKRKENADNARTNRGDVPRGT